MFLLATSFSASRLVAFLVSGKTQERNLFPLFPLSLVDVQRLDWGQRKRRGVTSFQRETKPFWSISRLRCFLTIPGFRAAVAALPMTAGQEYYKLYQMACLRLHLIVWLERHPSPADIKITLIVLNAPESWQRAEAEERSSPPGGRGGGRSRLKQPATHTDLRFDRCLPALDSWLITRGEASCVTSGLGSSRLALFAVPRPGESPEATWEKIKLNVTR